MKRRIKAYRAVVSNRIRKEWVKEQYYIQESVGPEFKFCRKGSSIEGGLANIRWRKVFIVK